MRMSGAPAAALAVLSSALCLSFTGFSQASRVELYQFSRCRGNPRRIWKVGGFELRGVCDRVPERREQAQAAFGVPAHAEVAALLADPTIDLVVVGVPPVAHAAVALEAIAAGKHVVCEKPFALRAEECDQVLSAAGRAGRLVTVYQSRRWDPDFVALRDAVAAGDQLAELACNPGQRPVDDRHTAADLVRNAFELLGLGKLGCEHAGQILLSEQSAVLRQGEPDHAVQLVALGRYRLGSRAGVEGLFEARDPERMSAASTPGATRVNVICGRRRRSPRGP